MSAARHAVAGERAPIALVAALAVCGSLSSAYTAHALAPVDAPRPRRATPVPAAPVTVSPVTVSPVTAAPASAVPSVAAECPPRLSLWFAHSHLTLSPSVYAPLREMAARATAHPDVVLLVEGHADARGSELQNLRISQARARAIAAVLMHDGVPRARIKTRAYGSWLPGDSPDDAHNRRVVVRVEGACDGPWTEVSP